MSPKDIATELCFHISSVYREIKRGKFEHLQSDLSLKVVYSPEVADRKYREYLAAKGAQLKIGNDHDLAKYLENKIVAEKYSPYAALQSILNHNLQFRTSICTTTLYTYIDKGVFLLLSKAYLPTKEKRKRKKGKVRRSRAPKGDSIEKRPDIVNRRETFGHWEMDTVKGKAETKKVILVLTERLSRQEIKIPMSRNTSDNVVKSLDKLESEYGELFAKIFQTITVDNGSEFAYCDEMESSCIHDGKRTKMYYCHPWSSWERGSNENQNKLIRRFIPKGTPIENYSANEIAAIQDWINNYPRKILGGQCSNDLFAEHVVLA